MMLLIAYDVNTETSEGRSRLRRVAKICQNYGQRVQNSVFECIVTPAQAIELENSLKKIIDMELDSLRFYSLGSNYAHRIKHIGAKPTLDIEAPLIF